MSDQQFVCHNCGQEIIPDRTCLTYWKHKATDDNVCSNGERTNAVPKHDPWERVRLNPAHCRAGSGEAG